MRLSQFLNELFEQGHVRLDEGMLDVDDDERQEILRELTAREQLVAANFPRSAPAFNRESAGWAATQFYAACQFVIYRRAPIEVVREKLALPPPAGETASQHYSVDLVWQFLPDLDRLLTTLAPQDPLREAIRSWGADWPLSSVGIKNVEPRRVDELLVHPGLRQAYADRIIQSQDSDRLKHEQVRDLVHAALGAQRLQSAAWCKFVAVGRQRAE